MQATRNSSHLTPDVGALMTKQMKQRELVIHGVSLVALGVTALALHLAGDMPRLLPAFRQLLFPTLLTLLVAAFPISAWQCKDRARDFRCVLTGYGVVFGVLVAEALCARLIFMGRTPRGFAALAVIGLAYGALQLCIAALAEKRLLTAAAALLLFAATGVVDLFRANSHHGSIHWVLEWTV